MSESNVISGFVELTLGSTKLDAGKLQSIVNNTYPLTISFAPRSTVPEVQGNKIIDSTDASTNTCTYKGNVYDLIDVQICSLMNKGYLYAGETGTPVAELIISFAPKQNLANTKQRDGILLCVPIYDSGTPNHNEYLMQLIDPNMPSCNYTNTPGTLYSSSASYRQQESTSLVNCVKSCCDDPNCLSYNFNNGTCSLNNQPSQSTTASNSASSGTINRGGNADNTSGKRSAITPTLQSIFYSSTVDTSQTSLAYTTTFNTVNAENKIDATRSLFIVVFPTGIHLTSGAYQQLLLQMRSNNSALISGLPLYRVPPRIRNYSSTVKSFTYDDSKNKVPQTVSDTGEISATQISINEETFKNRFEWFTKPPLLSKSGSSASFNSDKCPYYKTSDYKCVPFNQLRDLSGNPQDPQDAYVIPGNNTLQNMLNKKQTSTADSIASFEAQKKATEDIITYGAIGVVGIVGIFALYKLVIWAKERDWD